MFELSPGPRSALGAPAPGPKRVFDFSEKVNIKTCYMHYAAVVRYYSAGVARANRFLNFANRLVKLLALFFVL